MNQSQHKDEKPAVEQNEPLCCPWCGKDDVYFKNGRSMTDNDTGAIVHFDNFGCKACDREFFA